MPAVTSEESEALLNPSNTLPSLVSNWRGKLDAQTILTRERVLLLVELGLLFLWAWSFALPYLNFDPKVSPGGVDYPLQINFNHVWTRVQECGLCAMWNGSTGGGAPAFADIFPAALQPLTIITTLGWGVINGSKLELLGIFFMAGLAQWWLARVIGLGTVARLWSGAMAVVAGNLAGRMQMGWINIALSTAACALVIPPLVKVCLTGARRDAILLGLILGAAILAGQGYMQIGLAFTFPAVLVLLPWGQPEFKRTLRRLALGAGLGVLIAAPFLLPFLLSYAQFGKAGDVDLRGALHFFYIPISFVVNDQDFLKSQLLGMQGYPALYTNFVGWVPILLALVGIRMAHGTRQVRIVIYLLLTMGLAIWGASLEPRLFLLTTFPNSWFSDFAQQLRSAPVIAGLAVTPLLAIAALGVDELWARLSVHVQVGVQAPAQPTSFVFAPKWLLLFPLVWSLLSVRSSEAQWMFNSVQLPVTYPVLNALHTPDLQWVSPPQQNFYLEPAIGMGLKLPWIGLSEFWKDKTLPPNYRVAVAGDAPEGLEKTGMVEDVGIYQAGSEAAYALIENDAGDQTVCAATGTGGDIDVHCNSPQGGTLTLRENSWAGWGAQVDGKAVALNSDRWLSLPVPSGEHVIQFRYRPLDFPLGVLLFLTGVGLAGYLWFKPD